MSPRSDPRPSRRVPRPSAPRPRDVDATKRRLIDAVGAILARDGFLRLGVNAVAQEARADKALIYRYFGGMPQLLEAYAESATFWPTVEEMAGGSLDELAARPLADRWHHTLTCYIAEIRKRPTTQEILAWEIIERNEVTARLEEVRERRGLQLMKALATGAPPSLDVAAISSLFAGSIHYLILRSRRVRVFNGVDLRTDEGWGRLEEAARVMILGAVRSAMS